MSRTQNSPAPIVHVDARIAEASSGNYHRVILRISPPPQIDNNKPDSCDDIQNWEASIAQNLPVGSPTEPTPGNDNARGSAESKADFHRTQSVGNLSIAQLTSSQKVRIGFTVFGGILSVLAATCFGMLASKTAKENGDNSLADALGFNSAFVNIPMAVVNTRTFINLFADDFSNTNKTNLFRAFVVLASAWSLMGPTASGFKLGMDSVDGVVSNKLIAGIFIGAFLEYTLTTSVNPLTALMNLVYESAIDLRNRLYYPALQAIANKMGIEVKDQRWRKIYYQCLRDLEIHGHKVEWQKFTPSPGKNEVVDLMDFFYSQLKEKRLSDGRTWSEFAKHALLRSTQISSVFLSSLMWPLFLKITQNGYNALAELFRVDQKTWGNHLVLTGIAAVPRQALYSLSAWRLPKTAVDFYSRVKESSPNGNLLLPYIVACSVSVILSALFVFSGNGFRYEMNEALNPFQNATHLGNATNTTQYGDYTGFGSVANETYFCSFVFQALYRFIESTISLQIVAMLSAGLFANGNGGFNYIMKCWDKYSSWSAAHNNPGPAFEKTKGLAWAFLNYTFGVGHLKNAAPATPKDNAWAAGKLSQAARGDGSDSVISMSGLLSSARDSWFPKAGEELAKPFIRDYGAV